MTRFQIVGIFEDKILIAGEFNGDGYFEGGHGEEVCSSFKEITDETGFKGLVELINKHFGYDEQIIFETDFDYVFLENLFDFKYLDAYNLYYNVWFSDYLYIKNFTNKKWEIIDREGTIIKVGPQGWITLNFGKLYEQDDPNHDIKCMSNVKISSNDYIRDLIEEEGWTVEEYNNGDTWDIRICSRAGEDFFFTVNTKEDIVTQILSEADNFDPNEHATEWIRSGDPTIPNIRDLIDDADWISDALCDLAKKVNNKR